MTTKQIKYETFQIQKAWKVYLRYYREETIKYGSLFPYTLTAEELNNIFTLRN